jgi:hypothetical protein
MATTSPDRMTFLEHLDELRVRLMHSIGALVVGTIACWGFHERIFHFLTQPLREAYPAVKFITTGPSEAFMMYMKMSFFVGIFLVAPYILYQVWAFISPGLYSHEKAYAVPFILAGSTFFILGGAFGHYYLFPPTFKFLFEFAGVPAQGGRILLVLLVVPARSGAGVPDPGHHLRAGAHRAGHGGLPDPPDEVRGAGRFRALRGHHPVGGRRQPDGAGRADHRVVPAGGGRGLALRAGAAYAGRAWRVAVPERGSESERDIRRRAARAPASLD